jgi:hypothetical protein
MTQPEKDIPQNTLDSLPGGVTREVAVEDGTNALVRYGDAANKAVRVNVVVGGGGGGGGGPAELFTDAFAGDGVGATHSLSTGGDISSISVGGVVGTAGTWQILLETSVDGVTWSESRLILDDITSQLLADRTVVNIGNPVKFFRLTQASSDGSTSITSWASGEAYSGALVEQGVSLTASITAIGAWLQGGNASLLQNSFALQMVSGTTFYGHVQISLNGTDWTNLMYVDQTLCDKVIGSVTPPFRYIRLLLAGHGGGAFTAILVTSARIALGISDGSNVAIPIGAYDASTGLPRPLFANAGGLLVSGVPPNINNTFAVAATGVQTTIATGLVQGIKYLSLSVTGSIVPADDWVVLLEGSLDGNGWATLLSHSLANGDSAIVTLAVPTPCNYFRVNCTTLALGAAASILVNVYGTA